MLSKKFELNRTDLGKIFRSILIIYGPVVLLLLTQIENGELNFEILIAASLSITVDILRRYLTDYTKA